MQWAAQLPDAAERDAAIKAIRDVAPVGIGVELPPPRSGEPSSLSLMRPLT